uniref:Putative secreted protein n=1 Tax=Anopheles darlingi TaxID=43151 RepID=A0A2M4DDS9_ANODA
MLRGGTTTYLYLGFAVSTIGFITPRQHRSWSGEPAAAASAAAGVATVGEPSCSHVATSLLSGTGEASATMTIRHAAMMVSSNKNTSNLFPIMFDHSDGMPRVPVHGH